MRGGRQHPLALKPESPSRPEIRVEIELGLRTRKGRVRGPPVPFDYTGAG